jgi:hypothetical protein
MRMQFEARTALSALLLLSLAAVSTNAAAIPHPALSTAPVKLICYSELDRSGNARKICATPEQRERRAQVAAALRRARSGGMGR